MTKSTIVLFLLFVRLNAGTYPQPELLQKPQRPNTAEWIRSTMLQSKQNKQIPSFGDRFQQSRSKERSLPQRIVVKQTASSGTIFATEIDSMIVFSGRDTILHVYQVRGDGQIQTVKTYRNGSYVNSLRYTDRWESDNAGNIIFRSSLTEEWNGGQWAPEYRTTERVRYDQGCAFQNYVSEIYETGEWIPLWTGVNGYLSLADRYGNTISSISFWSDPSGNWSIEFDTAYCLRSYSSDSATCDIAWDSTLTFLILNIDQPINSKKDLLDRIAQGNRILSSRAVITRASDGSSWSEQREDLIDGVWKFRSSWSIEDSTDAIDIIDVKYYQDSILVSFRTIREPGPYNRRYTNAQLLNGSWVFQTRETVYNYYDTIVYYIDTLEIIEQWRDGHWGKSSINRTLLDDQHRVVKMSRVSWQDSAWIPSDRGMFFFSADRQLGYWFYGNTLTIHRSIDNSTRVAEHRLQVPSGFELRQNFPNPFNPSTTLGFTLQVSGITTLKIYDALGREISTLVNEHLEAGVYHERTFDASHLASGIYFARLTSGGASQMKKMVLMK